jgi:hypothetical protein
LPPLHCCPLLPRRALLPASLLLTFPNRSLPGEQVQETERLQADAAAWAALSPQEREERESTLQSQQNMLQVRKGGGKGWWGRRATIATGCWEAGGGEGGEGGRDVCGCLREVRGLAAALRRPLHHTSLTVCTASTVPLLHHFRTAAVRLLPGFHHRQAHAADGGEGCCRERAAWPAAVVACSLHRLTFVVCRHPVSANRPLSSPKLVSLTPRFRPTLAGGPRGGVILL